MIGKLQWMLLCTAICAFGQVDQGIIYGTVRDTSGSTIPKAAIELKNPATNASWQAVTGGDGLFSIPNLPVGDYDLSVTAEGFKAYRESGIRVAAAARVSVGVEMQVGLVSESVTVEANTVQVQQDTALIGRTVDSRQINDLALNGRNPLNLALMKAGVVGGNFNNFNPDNLGANSFTINGSGSTNNAVTIDGVYSVRTRSGTAAIGVFNVDSIQEVQILSANYPAEYGRVDGGQVRFVSKSGSRDFHGTAFTFFRNSALDANSWTRNRSPNPDENSDPAAFRFNQPGFSLGGPVYVPRHWNQNRDKLFFFWSEEWVRFRREQTNTGTAPSERMRNGDFSELLNDRNPFTNRVEIVRDPDTGAPFANNVIPQARLSRNGLGLLRAFPLPTAGFQQGTANWIQTLAAPRDSRKDLIRLDYYAGKHRIAFSGQNYAYSEINPFRGNFDRVGTSMERPNRTGVINITSTLNPRWVNDFSFSAANDVVRISNLPDRPFSRSAAGIDYPYMFPGTKEVEDKIPTVQMTGFSVLDGGPYPASSSGPMYTLANNTTWLPGAGRHTLKFGFFFERAEQNNFDQIVVSSNVPGGTNNQNGRFEFAPTGNPLTTGVAVANAALGYFNTYGEIGRRAYTLLRGNSFEAFVQDTWRIHPRLTLELGLRYSYFQPWYAEWNDIANFDERYYRPENRAVVHPTGGYLVSGDPYNGIVLPGSGFPESARGRIPAEDVAGVDRLFHDLPRGLVNDFKLQFSPRFGVAWQVQPKMVVRGGFGVYQGRTQFFSSYLFGNPPNQLTQGVTNGDVDMPGGSTLREFPFQVRALDRDYRYPTAYTYSVNVQREMPGSVLLEVGYVGKHSINLRGARNINQMPVGTVQANPGINPDSLRPWHGLGIITLGEYNRQSNYNSLQISADRRFRSGLAVGVAYTFSKLIDNTSTPYDAYNVNLVRAISSLDRTHVLNLNFIYELPFLRNSSHLLGKLAGNWQISGVTFFRSGEPLSVVDSTDTAGVGPGSGSQPWNLTGDVDVSGDRGLDRAWFNPAAFARPALGTFGNAGLNILRGPSFQNWDLALFKNFRFAAERVNAQIRLEAFNFLNHPLLDNPNTNPRGGSFGYVTSKSGERNLQLGLKFSF